MKKFLLFVVTIFVCSAAYAGNFDVIVNKVSLKKIAKEGISMSISFDWSNATYDKSESVVDHFGGDYDYIVNNCAEMFVSGFNDKAKSQLTLSDENVEYKCVLEVTNVDMFYQVMSFVPGWASNFWGVFRVYSAETDELLYEVKIDNYDEGRDFTPNDSYGKTFEGLGEDLAKLK